MPLALLAALKTLQSLTYHGFPRLDFEFLNRPAILVKPKTPAPGNPWIWRTEFFDHRPQVDLALLEKGFHLAYLDLQNQYGTPVASYNYSQFRQHLTSTHNLNPRVVLEGFSRGGLSAYNWAASNSDKVMAIYGDAPVCDFKSWPFNRAEAQADQDRLVQAYGFPNREAALAYPFNPVDNLAPLAQANIPIIHVVGQADEVVPVRDNTNVLERRYKILGGTIQVIRKPGIGHHPHSLDDPTPIVQFILHHQDDSKNAKSATLVPTPNQESRYNSAGWQGRSWLDQHQDSVQSNAQNKPNLVFLGDSISQGFGGPGRQVGTPGGASLAKLSNYKPLSMGISGDRTQNVLWRLQNGAFDKHKPAFVAVLIGVNNLPHDPPENIAKGITAVIEEARKQAPRAEVILHALFPVGKDPSDPRRAKIKQINDQIKTLAEHPRVHFLDLTETFLNPDGTADLTKMADDALHLRPAGYEAWSQSVKSLVDSLSSQNSKQQ